MTVGLPNTDVDDVAEWIRQYVRPAAPIALVHARPWATVLRVPLETGCAYFKACAPVQAFEPRLTHDLSTRWPDRVGEVLAVDLDRHWLLLADAGTQLRCSATLQRSGCARCRPTRSCRLEKHPMLASTWPTESPTSASHIGQRAMLSCSNTTFRLLRRRCVFSAS